MLPVILVKFINCEKETSLKEFKFSETKGRADFLDCKGSLLTTKLENLSNCKSLAISHCQKTKLSTSFVFGFEEKSRFILHICLVFRLMVSIIL